MKLKFEILKIKNIEIDDNIILSYKNDAFPCLIYILKNKNSFKLIYGKKCIEQAKINKLTEITAVTLENNICELSYIIKKLLPFNNIFDELKIINNLKYFNIKENEINSKIIPLFNCCPHKPLNLDEYNILNSLTEKFKTSKINTECLLMNKKIDNNVFNNLCELILTKKTSNSNQLKIFKLVEEIIDTKILDKINNYFLNNKELNFNEVYNYIYELTHPEFIKTKNEFENIIEQLKLPNFVNIIPPTFFEGNNYRFIINAKNYSQLKNACEKLIELSKNNGNKKWLP